MHNTKAISPFPAQPSLPNSRSVSADFLKVLSIFAVVFIHSGNLIPFAPSKFDFQNAEKWLHMTSRILRFCVPVFIFLWSYFLEKSIAKRGNKIIMSRFLKLLIPFTFWSVVYFVYTADFQTLSLSGVITKHWSGYGWAGQYYFVILFQLMILFPLVSTICRHLYSRYTMIYIISVLMFVITAYSGLFDNNLLEKLGERPFVYWLPYMVLGIIYAHNDIFKPELVYANLLGLIIVIPLELFYLLPGNERPYLTPFVFLFSLTLLGILKFNMSGLLSLNQVSFITYIANNTLGIFCLNPLIVITLYPIIRSLGIQFQFPGGTVIVPILSTAIVSALCLILIELLKRVKLGFLIAN